MHERHLAEGLVRTLEAAARSQGACRVVAARVRLGPLAHCSPDHLRSHFREAARGTAAEGCRLEVREAGDLEEWRWQDASGAVVEEVELEV